MASGNYFKNFQFTEYKFGDNTAQFDLFNNLTPYPVAPPEFNAPAYLENAIPAISR